MNTLKNNLEQREKTELIIIIQHMLRQEPDLQWLLATPLPGEETYMTDRLKKEDFVRLLTAQMNADEATATAWVDGFVETLYESFKAGKGVTLPGFGGFYVRPEPESWVFKFNPGQRLRALFGWSSTYTVELLTCLICKEELDAKGNQSVGDVPTQNIFGFSPRIAENGSHHKGK